MSKLPGWKDLAIGGVLLHELIRGRQVVLCNVSGSAEHIDLEGIGGLTFGADPLAVATAYTSELKGRTIRAFSIEKTALRGRGVQR